MYLITAAEEELIPPAFSQKPKFQNVDEGSTVSFTAKVVATPKPDVSTCIVVIQ